MVPEATGSSARGGHGGHGGYVPKFFDDGPAGGTAGSLGGLWTAGGAPDTTSCSIEYRLGPAAETRFIRMVINDRGVVDLGRPGATIEAWLDGCAASIVRRGSQ